MNTRPDVESKAVDNEGVQAEANELTQQELDRLAGAMEPKETCTATEDTGMMGCPG